MKFPVPFFSQERKLPAWKFGLIFVLFLLTKPVFSQQDLDKEQIIQNRIEFISEQLESEDIDLTDLENTLDYYYEHPININATNADELRSLMLLTDLQINSLLIHIQQKGALKSVDSLVNVRFWDDNTIELVRPFITTKEVKQGLKSKLGSYFKNGSFDSFLRYQRVPQKQAGYAKVPMSEKEQSSKYYYGNQDKYYARFRYSYLNKMSIGLTMEKDPGEQFFRGINKYGFDFYSFHLYYGGGKYLRSVVVGDYSVQIGQGLNMWTGYAMRKTPDATSLKRSATPLKPYTSSDEARFLRGAAAVVGYKNWSLLVFGSYKKVDGSVFSDSTSSDDLDLVTSIDLTGLHRTTGEIAKKNSFTEMIAGANAKYENNNFTAGVAAIYQSYNKPLNQTLRPDNQFSFRGKEQVSLSADYSYVWRNISLYGEGAYAGYGGQFAVIQGLTIGLGNRTTFNAFYRNYSRGYSTFYNNGMGEWSTGANEEGIYFGIKSNISKKWSVNTFYDLFRRPWLSYGISGPFSGHDFLAQVQYRPNSRLIVYARFRNKLKGLNAVLAPDGGIKQVEDKDQKNYRLNLDYRVTKAIQLKSRIEFVTYKTASNGKEHGILMQQDVAIRPKHFPVDFTLRYAIFKTDSYNSRIYSYENNALYTYSIPTYYLEGSRFYILLHYKFLKHFDLWVKYGQFLYNNRQSIGTGPETILGDMKSDITVQLRFRI